jgi:hypothetical protein
MARKAKSGRPKFTAQLSKALIALRKQESKLLEPDNHQLYSLVYKGGKYQWITLVATDGLLISEWHTDDATGPKRKILVGVVIQSEQSTSQTKPNPLGKAAAALTPLGLWVDIKRDGKSSRERLDVSQVLLLVPEPSDAERKKKHPMVRQNVKNVVDTVEQAHMLELKQGANSTEIASQLADETRRWLFGRGRPNKITK